MEKTRILIIDNDKGYKEMLKTFLKELFGPSCTVATTDNGEKAIWTISNNTFFNLIFMSENNAPLELSKEIKEIRSLTPRSKLVLMLSATDPFTSQGASAVFNKDCTNEEIEKVIKRVLV